MAFFLRKRGQFETEHSAPVNVGHVRLAHGAFVRSMIFTVAILAQGTNRGDALCAALLLRRVGSNPTRALFLFVAAQVVRKSTKVGAGKPTLWATGAAPRCSYAPLRRRAAASGSGGDFLRPAVFARTVTVETL